MAAGRRVTATGRDPDGDIAKLCGSWGNVTQGQAILHIEAGIYKYYVQQPGTSRVDVHVVNGLTSKYLRTDPDPASNNNLDNLPDC